jgi:hypothetical protein
MLISGKVYKSNFLNSQGWYPIRFTKRSWFPGDDYQKLTFQESFLVAAVYPGECQQWSNTYKIVLCDRPVSGYVDLLSVAEYLFEEVFLP